MFQAAFTSLLASAGGYMVPASQPFLAYVIPPAWPGPLTLLSKEVPPSPRWICSWPSPNNLAAIEKQANAMVNKGPIFSQSYRWVYILLSYICHQRGSCILMHALVILILIMYMSARGLNTATYWFHGYFGRVSYTSQHVCSRSMDGIRAWKVVGIPASGDSSPTDYS